MLIVGDGVVWLWSLAHKRLEASRRNCAEKIAFGAARHYFHGRGLEIYSLSIR